MRYKTAKISKKHNLCEAYADTFRLIKEFISTAFWYIFFAVTLPVFIVGNAILIVGTVTSEPLFTPTIDSIIKEMAIVEDFLIAIYLLYVLCLWIRFIHRSLHVPLTGEELDALSITDIAEYMAALRVILTANIPFLGQYYYKLPREIRRSIQKSIYENFAGKFRYDEYKAPQPVFDEKGLIVTHMFTDDEVKPISELRRIEHFTGGERKGLSTTHRL